MTRQQIAAQLEPVLPIRTVAAEGWLMVGDNISTWTVVREMRFG
jgi:hypothetical protein